MTKHQVTITRFDDYIGGIWTWSCAVDGRHVDLAITRWGAKRKAIKYIKRLGVIEQFEVEI